MAYLYVPIFGYIWYIVMVNDIKCRQIYYIPYMDPMG